MNSVFARRRVADARSGSQHEVASAEHRGHWPGVEWRNTAPGRTYAQQAARLHTYSPIDVRRVDPTIGRVDDDIAIALRFVDRRDSIRCNRSASLRPFASSTISQSIGQGSGVGQRGRCCARVPPLLHIVRSRIRTDCSQRYVK